MLDTDLSLSGEQIKKLGTTVDPPGVDGTGFVVRSATGRAINNMIKALYTFKLVLVILSEDDTKIVNQVQRSPNIEHGA